MIEAKGSKKVMLRNVMRAKFDRILNPIANQVLDGAIVRDVQPRSLRLHFDVQTKRFVPVRSALRVRAD